MILSKDGKYYFDQDMKIEYTKALHLRIIEILFGDIKNFGVEPYSIKENNILFNFYPTYGEIKVISSLNKACTQLIVYPVDLLIKLENGLKETINVFSKEQFETILEYYKIEYPSVNSLFLTNEIKDFIFGNNMNIKLEVSNIPLCEMFNEDGKNLSIINHTKNTKETSENIYNEILFEKLSKYIQLYMKSEQLKMKDFPEKEYLYPEDFFIKNEEKIDYFYSINDLRGYLWFRLEKIINKNECFFMTGPHGIGKTFTLLGFLIFNKNKNYHYIYINLDILSQEKNFLKIIFYEAKNLFDNVEEYIKAFKYIEKSIEYPTFNSLEEIGNGILLTISYLIEYIDGIKINKIKDSKYIIVIDQFKYLDDISYDSFLLKKIRKQIEGKKGFSLIVCSSLNYFRIKKNLIMRLLNRQNECEFNFEYFNKLCEIKSNKYYNNYLSLFGYLPQFCQIEKLINKKYINAMKKIIKQKLNKFYLKYKDKENYNLNKEDIFITRLKWIQENLNKKLSKDQIIFFIENNPIKYFSLDLNNYYFDYLFPLVGIVIDEIIKSKELKKASLGRLNESQREWYFKHLLFDKIKNSNCLFKLYIENIIQIKSAFNKEKIKNFDNKANTLFYYSYSNIKRYNAVIYVAEGNYSILINASLYKTKKELEKYNKKNLGEDIAQIEKFFKSNEITPEKYYLIFVLDYDNYCINKDNIDTLLKLDYNYCFYNQNKDELIDNEKEFKKIEYDNYNYNYDEQEDKSGIIFVKNKVNLVAILSP